VLLALGDGVGTVWKIIQEGPLVMVFCARLMHWSFEVNEIVSNGSTTPAGAE